LFDISGLAFSPNGQLYATDLASTQNSEGGLFQLIAQLTDGRQTLTARKATPLDKPSAMAFAKDGTLYVTLLGSKPAEANSRPSGKLVRVAL
jgi:glucose/arabinose dehydrogenase